MPPRRRAPSTAPNTIPTIAPVLSELVVVAGTVPVTPAVVPGQPYPNGLAQVVFLGTHTVPTNTTGLLGVLMQEHPVLFNKFGGFPVLVQTSHAGGVPLHGGVH